MVNSGRVADNPERNGAKPSAEDLTVSCPQQARFPSFKEKAHSIRVAVLVRLLYGFIKALVQRAAGDRPEVVTVFFRVSRIRVRIGCLRALPFFNNCEMIRSHRVL